MQVGRVCPGNYESAGKRYSGNTGQANRWLRSALVQAANAAIKCKQSYLAVVYRRLAARRGLKGNSGSCSPHPDGALSHAAQTTALSRLGAGYFDQRQQQRTLHRLQHRAEQRLSTQPNLSPLRLLTARFSKGRSIVSKR